jgi:hypothetical protein
MDTTLRFQCLDLVQAIAPPESESFLRYLWVRPELRPTLPRFARLALPALSDPCTPRLPGLPIEEASATEAALALGIISQVAPSIVPTAADYAGICEWISALVSLEVAGDLAFVEVNLTDNKRVRGCVWAIKQLDDEVARCKSAYYERWRCHGGWIQLTAVLHLEMFRRLWDSVGPDVTAQVVDWVQARHPAPLERPDALRPRRLYSDARGWPNTGGKGIAPDDA